jgi:hypothetical protein
LAWADSIYLRQVIAQETFKVGRNLQYPINSGGDDFSISFLPESKRTKDAPYAFFTSNREGGVGDDDLYSLADKPVVVLLKGLVYDRESGQPIAGAGVKLINSTAKILSEPKNQ